MQKINYTSRAPGELSAPSGEFSVESARVHLVIPLSAVFFVEERQVPSASVVLKLTNPNSKPDQKEISAILNMMLMAVEGLDKGHVSITDNGGKVLYQPEEDSLAGASSTQMEHRLQVQRNLERRIEEMLQPLFGPGRVIAKVNADMDFSQKTIRREFFDPENRRAPSANSAVRKASRAGPILKRARRTPIFAATASPLLFQTRTAPAKPAPPTTKSTRKNSRSSPMWGICAA